MRITLLYLRLGALLFLLGAAFSGRYPPAYAQTETVEGVKFADVNDKLKDMGAKQDRMFSRQNDIDSRINNLEGMVKGVGIFITALTGIQIIYTKKTKES